MNKCKYLVSLTSLFQFFTLLFLFTSCFAEKTESRGQLLINKYLECNDTNEKEKILKSLDNLNVSLDNIKSWIRGSVHYNVIKPGIYRKLAPIGKRKGEYFIYVPASYVPDRQWPVIVALHGVGGRGTDQIKAWISSSNHNNEYIIIAPTYGPGLWWEEEAEQLFISVLDDFRKSFPIDTNRIYLTGFSSGGHAAWYFAIRYPWLFAAINPIAGECPLPSFISNIMHVPAYIVHGGKDTVIPVEAARDAYARLQKLNYPVLYKELPEQTHRFPLSETKSTLDWFRTKQRVIYPGQITYITDSTKYDIAYWIEITEFSELVGHVYGMQRDAYGRLSKPDELPETAQVKAGIDEQKNEINVTVDGVKALRLYLEEEMIDMNKPLHILINGKTVFMDSIKVSIRSVLETAKKRNDREALFSNFIDLKVNQ
ncbi:MAG: hypothetical protein E3K37_11545 [Candidatus Kuenenia sp.]|nr:hypothetical protein [Candidatus Kuenenia hertensis]